MSTAKNVGQILEAIRLVNDKMKELDEKVRRETNEAGIKASEETMP